MYKIDLSLKRYICRNDQALEILNKGIKGGHQKSFDNPKRISRRLQKEDPQSLYARNPRSHSTWMRALTHGFVKELRLRPPHYHLKTDVHFGTITSRQICYRFNLKSESRFGTMPRCVIAEALQYYQSMIPAYFDCIGIMEPAIFCSDQRYSGSDITVHLHVHLLFFNVHEPFLRMLEERLRSEISAYKPGATSTDFTKIKRRDLIQMIWYLTKCPRHRFQMQQRKTKRWQSNKRQINPITMVRYHRLMGRMRMDELTFATGRGSTIFDNAKKLLNK